MLIQLIAAVFKIYEVIIIIRVLFSWIPVNRSNRAVDWVYRLTEPILEPIRKILPLDRLGIDISPLLLLLAMSLIQKMLFKFLFSF